MLVDRVRELVELNSLLTTPAARLVAATGRRRLGKTSLLLHWAKTSGHPYLYWVASHFPSSVLLHQFSQSVWQHARRTKRRRMLAVPCSLRDAGPGHMLQFQRVK